MTTAQVDPDARRLELGGFLRSRRERITPDQVGLPPAGRRRTPGLRREEVAQLAGVGVTWYTWLEQGRDIRPSSQVLDAIARTLRLDQHEQTHLFSLAGVPAPVASANCRTVSPAIGAMLDKLEPYPAVVQNARGDLLAYNRSYDWLMGGLDRRPATERNCMWLAFTCPEWRSRVTDLDEYLARLVAQFRVSMADNVDEPGWKDLVRRLRAVSPEFERLWTRHDVTMTQAVVKTFTVPGHGSLRFDFSYLWLGPRSHVRMATLIPADEHTAAALPDFPQPTG